MGVEIDYIKPSCCSAHPYPVFLTDFCSFFINLAEIFSIFSLFGWCQHYSFASNLLNLICFGGRWIIWNEVRYSRRAFSSSIWGSVCSSSGRCACIIRNQVCVFSDYQVECFFLFLKKKNLLCCSGCC